MSDEEDIDRLKGIRAGNRGVVTRFQNEYKNIIDSTDEYTKAHITRIRVILKALEEKLTTVTQLDARILEKIAVENIEDEIERTSDIEISVQETIANIKEFLEEQTKPDAGSVTSRHTQRTRSVHSQAASTRPSSPALSDGGNSQAAHSEHNSIGSSARHFSAKVKLPKIPLPKFNGDITKYFSFWDSFQSMIDSNEDLSSVDKFNYLQRSLEGAAARAIEGLPLRERTYAAAVELLRERFGNKQKVINTHMDQLIELRSCETANASQLRLLYDKINIQVRGLEALGVTSDTYGVLLAPLIMSRLPNQISLQISRQTTKDFWSLDELMILFRKEVEAREMNQDISVKEQHKPKGGDFSQRKPVPSASALHTQNSKQTYIPNCVFCRGKHYSANCEKIQQRKDRLDILKRDKRCFRCLKGGHISRNCDRKCRNCNGFHHQSICDKEMEREKKQEDKQEESESVTAASTVKRKRILLQTARTFAFKDSDENKVPVRILFDSGSQNSYVTNELKDRLNLDSVGQETLNLNTFGNNKFHKQTCSQVKLNIEIFGEQHIEINALSYPTICSPIKSHIDVELFPHLLGLNLADDPVRVDNDSDSIDILIGADQYYEFVSGEIIRDELGPVAINSKLGWLVSGPTSSSSNNKSNDFTTSNVCIEIDSVEPIFSENAELLDTFKKIFETEPPEAKTVESEKVEFIETWRIRNNGERYEVSLPLRDDLVESLPDNYELCLGRLNSLQTRLKGNLELFRQYKAVFLEQLESGVIEKVPANDTGKNCHFLSHHGVVRNDRETSKLRVVFDASAKSSKQSLSLNDCLETGPNFVPPLFDTLINFRTHSVALTADIEKAFLQISIQEEDRNKLRFLWFEGIESDNPTIVQMRFCRLPFGLKSSPAILGATMHYHASLYRDKYPEVSQVISNCYVDDMTTGSDSIQTGLEIYSAAKEITQTAGFNLRKWNSNSVELLTQIAEREGEKVSHYTDQVDSISGKQEPTKVRNTNTKVLGVQWDTANDELEFDTIDTAQYASMLPPTKRSLLKISAKIFDPLGVLSPYVITLKSFFQQLCVAGIDWDEELQGEYRLRYYSLVSELDQIHKISLSRCYFQDKKVNSVQLHGFSDASEIAFASVIYLRIEYVDGEVELKFVSSKARVSPIKGQSIPRLELMGACLLAKHVDSVKHALHIERYTRKLETFFWVDSSTVLCWIRNNKPWKQFVRHRVNEILSLSARQQWRFCPGVMNPADLPSRGTRGSTLSQNKAWLGGPLFLSSIPSDWPVEISTGDVDNEQVFKEIVQNPPKLTYSLVNQTKLQNIDLKSVIDNEKFSSKARLIRVLGWVLRFIRNLKSRDKVTEQYLNALEIDRAEQIVIRSVQLEAFDSELTYLSDDRNSNRKPPIRVFQLNLFIDENGILRAKTRMKNASLETECKEPILLPCRSHFSQLVVQEYHDKVFHNGVKETLNAIRQRFWILRGRETAKKVLRRCIICKKLEGLPFKPFTCHDLPPVRVEEGPPFINTGIDFAGPLYVVDRKSNPKTNFKVYVCLFTCAATRAVHLELVEKLDISSFLRAFRRFSARRGLPRTLLSDNATTFKAASKDIRRIILSREVQTYLSDRGISWHFIVQRAAWHGAIWERLVRSVKRCLRKVIGRASIIIEELQTLLVEIEGIINSRPLTYVYDDLSGVSYPLTPSQLIYGYSTARSPNGRHFEIISTNESLTKRSNYHRQLLKHFAKRWKQEYLLALREVASLTNPSNEPIVSVGDIVVLKDEQTKRVFWKLGEIVELIVGRDKNIRAAKVKSQRQRVQQY